MRHLALAALLLVAALPAQAEPAFEACRACHAVEKGAPTQAGPNLFGLMGRIVGGDEDYDYSPVLKSAFKTGQRWDSDQLDRFLQDPEAMFPGLWMASRGIRDAAERRALVAFMAGLGAK
jgi:cytochrome c